MAGGGLGARSIGSAKGKGSKCVLGISSAKQIKSSKLCIDEKLEADSGMGTGASMHFPYDLCKYITTHLGTVYSYTMFTHFTVIYCGTVAADAARQHAKDPWETH